MFLFSAPEWLFSGSILNIGVDGSLFRPPELAAIGNYVYVGIGTTGSP